MSSAPYRAASGATGSTHAYFGHDEWRRHAPGLKTLEDALISPSNLKIDRANQLNVILVVGVNGSGKTTNRCYSMMWQKCSIPMLKKRANF